MSENCAVDDCQKRELLARIEALEAALREIDEAVLAEREACAAIAAKRPHHSGIEIAELIHNQSSPSAAIARAALAPEQDK